GDEEGESCAQFQCGAALARLRKAPTDATERVIVWRSVELDMATVKQQIGEHYDMSLLDGAQAMMFEQLKKRIEEGLGNLIKQGLDDSIAASKPPALPLVYIAASWEDRDCAEMLQEIAVSFKGAAKIMENENPRE